MIPVLWCSPFAPKRMIQIYIFAPVNKRSYLFVSQLVFSVCLFVSVWGFGCELKLHSLHRRILFRKVSHQKMENKHTLTVIIYKIGGEVFFWKSPQETDRKNSTKVILQQLWEEALSLPPPPPLPVLILNLLAAASVKHKQTNKSNYLPI